jgi:hypothetical protein
MESRHALVVDTRLTLATGTAEREAALAVVAAHRGTHRITLSAKRPAMPLGLSAICGSANVKPHVVRKATHRRSRRGRPAILATR